MCPGSRPRTLHAFGSQSQPARSCRQTQGYILWKQRSQVWLEWREPISLEESVWPARPWCQARCLGSKSRSSANFWMDKARGTGKLCIRSFCFHAGLRGFRWQALVRGSRRSLLRTCEIEVQRATPGGWMDFHGSFADSRLFIFATRDASHSLVGQPDIFLPCCGSLPEQRLSPGTREGSLQFLWICHGWVDWNRSPGIRTRQACSVERA